MENYTVFIERQRWKDVNSSQTCLLWRLGGSDSLIRYEDMPK